MIAIIDYGSGNTYSVYNSLQYLGYQAEVVHDPDKLKEAERIILPGVGAFGECMDFLNHSGFTEAIHDEVRTQKKPFLGICLGMQMLATTGTEKGFFKGLDLIPGVVSLFNLNDKNLKIPHVGWNDIEIVKENPILLAGGKDMAHYFVHSYHFQTENPDHIIATCDYGGSFTCAVMHENVIGTQFHPEKSQKNGLAILERFADWRYTAC